MSGLQYSHRRFPPSSSLSFTSRVLLLALVFCAVSEPALAYIDPNTGGLLYQLLMPVLAMISIGYAFLKRRISAALKYVFRRKSSPDADSTKAQAQ